MSLDLQLDFHQNAYLADQAQTIYALLHFAPQAFAGRMPLDLRLVLDHSGSMSSPARSGQRGDKLTLLKEAVIEMIGHLEPGDRLQVVAFDDQAESLFDDVIRGDRDLERARKAVKKLQVGGGTNLDRGLALACADAPLPDRVNRLVVVTDGETYGEEDCTRLAFDSRGTSTWLVYGIGVDYNDHFLDQLAQANGGQFVHLSDLDAATAAFVREVKVMGEVALTNLVASVEPVPGIELAKADRIVPQFLPVAIATPQFLSVDLGDVDRARGQKLLLQLTVPAMPAGRAVLARIKASYHVPARKLLNQLLELELAVTMTADAGAIVHAAEVLRTVQLAGAGRLATLGLAEAASGQGGKAAMTLASAGMVYDQLGLDDLSTKLKTLTSTLATQGAFSGDSEDVKRTLTTMARQAWEDAP